MPLQIRFKSESVALEGTLYDSPIAARFAEKLPLKVSMSRWGEEYYGSMGTDLSVPSGADARDLMEIGELAYWPPGTALCIFFGKTPASHDNEPRAASEVYPLGKVDGDFEALKKLGGSVTVTVEKVE